MRNARVNNLEGLVLRHALEVIGVGDTEERDRRLHRIEQDARMDALAMGSSRVLADEWARTLTGWIRTVLLSIECGDHIGNA